MRFIYFFQHIPSGGPHTTSIDVAELGSHWSKKSLTADMTSYNNFFTTPCNGLVPVA